MKRDDLLRWAMAARPGQSVAYHHGFLARDCGTAEDGVRTHAQNMLRATRTMARALSDAHVVCLVQRRLGAEVFDYIALRTARDIPNTLTGRVITAFAEALQAA